MGLLLGAADVGVVEFEERFGVALDACVIWLGGSLWLHRVIGNQRIFFVCILYRNSYVIYPNFDVVGISDVNGGLNILVYRCSSIGDYKSNIM